MGKRRQTMRDRAEAAADGADTKAVAAEALVVPSITKSSHFQRKLTKRLKFSEKLRGLHEAAIAKTSTPKVKSKRRKGVGKALGSLEQLVDSLGEIKTKSAPGVSALKLNPKTLKSRARTTMGACEAERMHSVMSHPAYQADPIAAIRRHLEATVKATEEAKELRAAVAGDGSGGTTADRRATSAAKKKAASARGDGKALRGKTGASRIRE